MAEKIKKLFEEVKESFIKGLPKAIADIVLKLITYTLPALLLVSISNWILNPEMDIRDIEVDILGDKLILSEENSAPNIGKEFVIHDIEENSVIDLSETYSYYAPELQIAFNGNGRIKSVYLFYEQNEVDNPNELIIQKASIPQKWRSHYIFISKKCSITCNYVNKAGKATKFIYLMLVGDDGTQNISCIYLDMNSEKSEIMDIEDIYQLTPNDISIFGLNKREIQQNIETILKLGLN